jgi:hypothetical protein
VGRIVVLGCGPAGLAAAQAAVDSCHEVVIISNTDKPSRQFGCQYLHAPIPGYEFAPKTLVGYWLIGTPEEYRQKVYGKDWTGKVSPEDFEGVHEAWDIRRTYEEMWKSIIHGDKAWIHVEEPIKDGIIPPCVYAFKPDKIISTIPATALCYRQEHEFKYHAIYASGSTSPKPYDENTIICDGTSKHDWYRIARVFVYQTTEWATQPATGEPNVCVPKPLSTDCNCYPEIARVGRYGTWKKSVLVHEVYPEVMRLLS